MKRVSTARWDQATNRWKINVQKDGERKTFYSSTKGRTGQRDCNAKADAWLDEGIEPAGARVRDLFAEYLETKKMTTSKSNWRKIESFGKVWILPEIGNKKIQNLYEQHLQNVINKMYAAGRSRKYLRNLLSTMTEFIKYCRKVRATTLFPENLEIPHGARNKGKKVLQPSDLEKLFSTDTWVLNGITKQDPYINAYRFQVVTGLRPGELIGLRWSDINGNFIKIQRSINYLGEETRGKNDNAIRGFVLSELAMKILEDQRHVCSDGKTVFNVVSHLSYGRQLKKYCESNGITPVSPYELRHTFVSVVKSQLQEGMVKPIVGHASNMDTFGIYGHEFGDEKAKSAAEINNVFHKLLDDVLK